MYLKEMGTVDLLTRQGEVDLSIKIEEGNNKILECIYEFPFVYEYFSVLKAKIIDEEVYLRTVVDLEKFYRKYINKKIPVTFEDASLNEETNEIIKTESENKNDDDEENENEINKKKEKKKLNLEQKKSKPLDEENFTISFMESKIEPKIFTILDNLNKTFIKIKHLINSSLEILLSIAKRRRFPSNETIFLFSK